jgi:Secretion system C-terminal sorting domain
MKKSILLLLLLVSIASAAQTGLSWYLNPPGLQIGSPPNGNNLDCDPQGNAWIVFSNAGFGKFDGGNWTIFNTSNSLLRTNMINALSHDHQNYLWIATDTGLARFDGSTWLWYDASNTILGTSRVRNVYARGNIALVTTQNVVVNTKFYSLNIATGVFQLIDIAPTVGLNQEYHYSSLCISPQGNFYIGSPALKKIVKVDGNGNQTLIDLTSIDGTFSKFFFDVDNTEKIWVSHQIFLDTSLTVHSVQNCSLTPDALLAFASPVINSYTNVVRRSFQDIPWFTKFNALTFANANASQHYVFLDGTPNFENIITGPSGESWLIGAPNLSLRTLYKFNPAAYSHVSIEASYVDDFLDVNEVVTRITPLADMHWNPVASFGPAYMVPKCSGVSSVFSSSMWIGGLDANNTLHVAAQTYRQNGLDFWPGPLDTLSASIDSFTSSGYNHVWKINRADIVNFVYQYQLGNVTNMTYPVPSDFLSWPAQGTGNFSRNLAPFVDNNNDGIYNPYDGDYPKIKGDQMCYSIFNDAIYPHSETGGNPFGLEFHKSSYASACPQAADSDRVINYTTYYDIEIFNRSNTTYHDMYIGMYSDVDLGNYLDDYIGCDTMLQAGFVYNGDNDDEGYGLNPPMQNVTVLSSPEANPNDGIDNDHDGIIDEAGEETLMSKFVYYDNSFTFWGNPQTTIHYYNYLKGLFTNGQPITYGGDGHGTGTNPTNIPCNYFFPGTPYDSTQWNEASGGNVAYDRRFLVSSGPFTLPAHDKTKITYAFVWTRDELNPNGINTSIARNRSDLIKIRQWFAADTIPSCLQLYAGLEENSQLKPLFNLYPNPADVSINIQYAAKSLKPLYGIYDVTGRLIKSGKLNRNISIINLSSLVKGNYIFEIADGNIRTSKSFVKQ